MIQLPGINIRLFGGLCAPPRKVWAIVLKFAAANYNQTTQLAAANFGL